MEHDPVITLIMTFEPIDHKRYGDFYFIREDRVVGSIHLEAAIRYAINSFSRQKNISDSLYMEIVLYLSLQRQISKAIEMMGIKGYKGKVIVLGQKEFPWNHKFNEIEVTSEKLTYWGVRSPLEILTRMAAFSIDST